MSFYDISDKKQSHNVNGKSNALVISSFSKKNCSHMCYPICHPGMVLSKMSSRYGSEPGSAFNYSVFCDFKNKTKS